MPIRIKARNLAHLQRRQAVVKYDKTVWTLTTTTHSMITGVRLIRKQS